MRILIDTDVLLDFAIGREPFFAASTRVFAWVQDHPGAAAVAWHSLSSLAYLAPAQARGFLRDLLKHVEVPTVGTREAIQALNFPMRDIEDALQAAAALAFRAEWIITRNVSDYRRSPVPALSPTEFAKKYAAL